MLEIQNCWEFRGCGRGPGGDYVDELGICPAATNRRYHGVNRGNAAGRFCWSVSGTLCEETSARKAATCAACSFYQEVERQEGRFFVHEPQELGPCPDQAGQRYAVLEAKPDPSPSVRFTPEAKARPSA
jgi:hypothetical protein